MSLDARIMVLGDALVLALWNRFSVPRIVVVRVLMLVWVLGSLVSVALRQQLGFMDVLVALMLLLIMASEEVREARWSPAMLNTHRLWLRRLPFTIFARWSIWLMNALFIAAAILVPGGLRSHTVVNIVALTASSLVYWLLYTLTPMNPPQRKTKEAALGKLAPVRT